MRSGATASGLSFPFMAPRRWWGWAARPRPSTAGSPATPPISLAGGPAGSATGSTRYGGTAGGKGSGTGSSGGPPRPSPAPPAAPYGAGRTGAETPAPPAWRRGPARAVLAPPRAVRDRGGVD